MSLTDVMCKKVLPQEKQYLLSDINDLSLRIDLNGNKYWSKLDSTIQRSIFRLLELMALQITKNGLCEIKINPVDLYKVEDNLSQLKLKKVKSDH